MEDSLKKAIKAKIIEGVELKCSSKNLDEAMVSEVKLTEVTPIQDPFYNYSFKGTCTIKHPVKNNKEGDYQEYSNCDFEGNCLAMDYDSVLITYISIVSEL